MDLLSLRLLLSEGKSIYELPLRVTFYARVSSDKDVQLNSLDNQVFYYKNKIKENVNWIYVDGYVDEGISGKSAEKRTNFMRMIKDAKSGLFDLILTKEISRFSRNTLDSIKYTQMLTSKGVGVFFETDNINTIDSDSELRLTIMASIAQDELRRMSERLRFGYKRAIEKGVVLGQDNMLGYNKKEGSLSINDDEAKIVRRIFEVYVQGEYGTRAIANMLEKEGIVNPKTGKPISASTLPKLITNPKYKGYYCSRRSVSADYKNTKNINQDSDKWIVYKDDRIPAIVSEELWDKANKLYKERGAKSKENAQAYMTRYPFSGKLFCAEHGLSYHRHVYHSKRRGDQEVWNCKLYRQKGKKDGCDSPTIYSHELVDMLYNVYMSVYSERAKIIDGLMELYSGVNEKDYTKESEKIQREIDQINAKKDKLLELVLEGVISKDELKGRNERFNEEIKTKSTDLLNIERMRENSLNKKESLLVVKKALEAEVDDRDTYVYGLTSVLLDRIIVHKQDDDKNRLKLEIILNTDKSFEAEIEKHKCISLHEIGISCSERKQIIQRSLSAYRGYYNVEFTVDVKLQL